MHSLLYADYYEKEDAYGAARVGVVYTNRTIILCIQLGLPLSDSHGAPSEMNLLIVLESPLGFRQNLVGDDDQHRLRRIKHIRALCYRVHPFPEPGLYLPCDSFLPPPFYLFLVPFPVNFHSPTRHLYDD